VNEAVRRPAAAACGPPTVPPPLPTRAWGQPPQEATPQTPPAGRPRVPRVVLRSGSTRSSSPCPPPRWPRLAPERPTAYPRGPPSGTSPLPGDHRPASDMFHNECRSRGPEWLAPGVGTAPSFVQVLRKCARLTRWWPSHTGATFHCSPPLPPGARPTDENRVVVLAGDTSGAARPGPKGLTHGRLARARRATCPHNVLAWQQVGRPGSFPSPTRWSR